MYDYDNAFIQMVLMICMFVLLIVLIINILGAIGEYKMFQKANKSGWAAFIPIYNDYILCTVTGVNPYWILFDILASVIGGLIPIIGTVLAVFIPIYFHGLLALATANSYGKSEGWAFGIFFLKPFFYLALGFGASQYLGEKAPTDVILEALGINKPKEKTTEATVTEETTTSNLTFCPNCGAKVEMSNSKFCTNCGKKL